MGKLYIKYLEWPKNNIHLIANVLNIVIVACLF